MKRTLSLFLSFILVVSIVTSNPMIVNAVSANELTFELNDDGTGYIISDCDENASGDLTIPDTYKFLPVIKIDNNAFRDCEKITSVSIPDSVTSIGDYSFYSCKGLAKLVIPGSVISIGENAFSCCTNITSITIANGLKSIGEEAFECCYGISSINLPDTLVSIGNNAFLCCPALVEISVAPNNTKYTSINGVLFDKKVEKLIWFPRGYVGSYVMPNSVKIVPYEAFSACESLTHIKISNNLPSVNYGMFIECSALLSVELHDNITEIDDYAFAYCENLSAIEIPDKVTRVGDEAFCGCQKLTEIVVPKSVSSIGVGAFERCINLKKVYLNGCREIGFGAFFACENLKSVWLPKELKSIDMMAFYYCDNLTDVHYNGNNKQKKQIVIGEDNEILDKVNWHYIDYLFDSYSDTGNDLEYPVYDKEAFIFLLKKWIQSNYTIDTSSLDLSTDSLEKYLNMPINIPLKAENGDFYILESENSVKDVMAYILFASNTQTYMDNVLNNTKNKIKSNNNSGAYKYFLDRVKNFNNQYNVFQKTWSGDDEFATTLSKLLIANSAMKAVNVLGVKSWRYVTDLYKIDKYDSIEQYDDLKYYVMSGGDTSYLNSYYKENINDLSQIISNSTEAIKLYVYSEIGESTTETIVNAGIDNLIYFANKNNSEYADVINNAKDMWDDTKTLYETIKVIATGSLLGIASTSWKLTNEYISRVKKVYEEATTKEAGWYALAYYYFSANNPRVLKSMFNLDSGAAEFDISRVVKYGFPIDYSDLIQEDLANYYESHAYKEYVYTPDKEFRLFLWNACNNLINIEQMDCSEYIDMLVKYIVAENNRENGNTGVSFDVLVESNDKTLGEVSGAGKYQFGEMAKITAIPGENVTFAGWVNTTSGETISKEKTYSFEVFDSTSITAQFIAGEHQTASIPRILSQTGAGVYYAGEKPLSLDVESSISDNGIKTVKWYRTKNHTTDEGAFFAEGNSVIPSTSSVGTYYYYPVITNTLTSFVGDNAKTTTATTIGSLIKVTVTSPIITGMEISTYPSQKQWFVGEVFDAKDIVIDIKYSDGTVKKANKYNVEYDFSTGGTKKVSIMSSGYSQTIYVDVVETKTGSIDGISWQIDSKNKVVTLTGAGVLGSSIEEIFLQNKSYYNSFVFSDLIDGFENISPSNFEKCVFVCGLGDNAYSYAINNSVSFIATKNATISLNSQNNYLCTDLLETSIEELVEISESMTYSTNSEDFGTGCILSLYNQDGYHSEYVIVRNNDITGDSVCDVLDCALAQLASSGFTNLQGAYLEAGDSDDDGEISSVDYQHIVNTALAS